jgi:hypothetical protein
MIEEIKKLLMQCTISHAAIVDDAYDEIPVPGDIEDSSALYS